MGDTYVDSVVLLCNTMNTETVKAWWASDDVLEARRRTKYDAGEGSLRDLLVELLNVVDEREQADENLPPCPVSEAYSVAAEEFEKGTVIGATKRPTHVVPAITQLLDLGAEPERLKRAFQPADVDRVLKKYGQWRQTVLTAARGGAGVEQLRDLAPEATYTQIADMLKTHGITVGPPVDRRRRTDGLYRDIMVEHGKGVRSIEIARTFGVSRNVVNNLVRDVRQGRKPELIQFLRAA